MPKAFDCTPHASKQIANFYFTALGGDRFECKCGNKRMQKLSAGYNNLLVHVFSQHHDFREEIRGGDNQSRLSKCYSKKATNIYKCIEWIFMENREHGFFENDLASLENIKLSPISRSSVTTYMGKITEAVEMQYRRIFRMLLVLF